MATYCLLIIFANRLDPDQGWQNFGSDLDPRCLTFSVPEIIVIWKKKFRKKVMQTKAEAIKKTACKELKNNFIQKIF